MKFLPKITLVILIIVNCILIGILITGYINYKIIHLSLVGNYERNVEYVKHHANKENELNILVLGDMESEYALFEEVLRKYMDNSNFIVICGDVVNHNVPEQWHLFFHELNECNLSIPIFACPGNHDLEIYKNYSDKNQFYKVFGHIPFAFKIDNSLFILMDNAIKVFDDTDYAWLEDILKKQKAKHIFLFVHCSPIYVPGYNYKASEDIYSRLLQLIKEYNIDYVFSGDYHGYYREVRDKTVFITTGGGGGKLRSNQKHHIIKIQIKDNRIKDEMVNIKPEFPLWDWLEYQITINIYAPAVNYLKTLFSK